MIISILGRQPEISIAELEQQFGAERLQPFSQEAAIVDTAQLDVQKFGGTMKAGTIIKEFPATSWHEMSKTIVHHYETAWRHHDGKITLGISVYGTAVASRDVQKTGLVLKQRLKKNGGSLRLIPNGEPILSTATSHHNKLGLASNKVELMVVYGDKKVLLCESSGAQNITALAARDQGRPKRDAFVGMLPPKLALTMINMANGNTKQRDQQSSADSHLPTAKILDPFCGTGVVLQEAALLGYDVYGTDLSEKMVDYSHANLQWLKDRHHLTTDVSIHHGDAIETQWQPPIDAVVSETYLGQPFSAPPAPEKLHQVRRNCNEIVSKFLRNLAPQITSGTPLCLAVPAWRDERGRITHLPLVHELEALGYKLQPLTHADSEKLLYLPRRPSRRSTAFDTTKAVM